MKILLTPYDDDWPRRFEKESSELQEILTQFSPKIEHIGSTAVSGLSSKPVIDIMIGFEEESEVEEAVVELKTKGYIYVRKFEKDTLNDRKFMIRIANAEKLVLENQEIPEEGELPDMEIYPRISHLHLVKHESPSWKAHLIFRDYLRNHPEIAAEYVAIKNELAKKDWKESNDYARAKSEFVQKVEALAKKNLS